MYTLLAEVVVVVHLLFIAFVVAGGFIVLWRPRLAWLHVPAVVWGVIIEFSGWICPLTPLENHLRLLGGNSVYRGDFIAHYIVPMIYPAKLSTSTQYILGALVIAVNLIIYALALHRHARRCSQS